MNNLLASQKTNCNTQKAIKFILIDLIPRTILLSIIALYFFTALYFAPILIKFVDNHTQMVNLFIGILGVLFISVTSSIIYHEIKEYLTDLCKQSLSE